MARTVKTSHGDEVVLRIDEAVAQVQRALPSNHPAAQAVTELAIDAERLAIELQDHVEHVAEIKAESIEAFPLIELVGDWMRGMVDWPEFEERVRDLVKGDGELERLIPRA